MSNLNQPHFQDETKAREYLEALVWPNGPVCPHCGSQAAHYKLEGKTTRPGLYKCRESECAKPFTVTVGTVFERSKIKLNVWLQAVFLICSSKKGISSLQLQRMLGVTYKTAWFMTHRIREAMTQPGGVLGGPSTPVEVDETYWGNKGKNNGKGGAHHSMKVVSLVERDGRKFSHHVARVNADTLFPILKKQIHSQSPIHTDESRVYTELHKHFEGGHSKVNHRAKEYVRGNVTTNSVESSFAILKRGLYGTFHHVGEQHLQRYANEFDFRWNTRAKLGYNDTQRTEKALQGIQGKRLTYRRISSQQTA